MNTQTEKVSIMPDSDLGQILSTFLKSQEKRDQLLRDELSKVSETASQAAQRSAESITRIEGVDGKIETAFELLNQSAAARQTNWPTLFAGAVVLGGVMTSILLPIRTDITENRSTLDANHAETRAMVQSLREADEDARVARAVLNEHQVQTQRMNRAWIDGNGRIAFPAADYPQLKN